MARKTSKVWMELNGDTSQQMLANPKLKHENPPIGDSQGKYRLRTDSRAAETSRR